MQTYFSTGPIDETKFSDIFLKAYCGCDNLLRISCSFIFLVCPNMMIQTSACPQSALFAFIVQLYVRYNSACCVWALLSLCQRSSWACHLLTVFQFGLSRAVGDMAMDWRWMEVWNLITVVEQCLPSFPQTVCPKWGVLTVLVGVKAGAWSGCSRWAAVFFL